MIGHSTPEYIFIRISIYCLRLIAPLSIAYVVASWYFGVWFLSIWLGIYAHIEAAFYLLVYLPRTYFMQKATVHPPLLSRTERESLFAKCFTRVQDIDVATGWFFSSPARAIKRDNVVEWLLWALFSTHRDGLVKEWEEELEGYISMMEKLLGHTLEHGFSDNIDCMKLTLDPVVSLHRPFIWYLIVAIVDTYTRISLYRNGFQHFSQHTWIPCFPPRLPVPQTRESPYPQLSYWYRPHLSETKPPVLFLHGIGIGLWPYLPFFLDLIAAEPEVGIIAIENLPISMRISPPPLGRKPMLDAIRSILNFHNFPEVIVAAHSYGTITAAHMLKDPELSTRVTSWLLVDPIPFLLHFPAVAYNFVYRQPQTANEWQLWYFASRDADVARALGRHFFWAENILWKEDLEGRKVCVVLSGRDQIVDADEVWRYLTGVHDENPRDRWEKDGLEVLYYQDLDHSHVFDKEDWRRPMVDVIARFSDAGFTSEDGPEAIP